MRDSAGESAPAKAGKRVSWAGTTAAEGGLRKIGLHTQNSQAARSQAKHEQPRMAGWAALSQAYQLRIPGYP